MGITVECLICGEPAIEYLDCFEDEGGCGVWAWCSTKCEAEVESRRNLIGVMWQHADHDGCTGECCANGHTRLDYWTVCITPRQLDFSEYILRSTGTYFKAWV